MNFDEVKDRLKETYKTRKCRWCKKPCKECDPKCNCFYCKFEDNYDLVVGDYQHIKDWIMSNLKFFKKLYREGLAEEDVLIRKWKKRQLFTIERTGTRILDWTTDNEVIGVPRRNHLPPDGYRIITPYHDFRKPKDLRLNYCQLCGKDLEYNYYIKHDEKKLCICIGHECAEAFCLSEVFVQILKNHMRWIVEKEFKKLEKPLKKWLKEKIETHPPNEKTLIRNLERIRRHFTKGRGKSSISAQDIAKLLLELDKEGFKVFLSVDTKKELTEDTVEKELTEDTVEKELTEDTVEKEKVKLILKTIIKMAGTYGYAVRRVQIIQQLENYGMVKHEIDAYIKLMLQKNNIYEFTPETYKISK